MAIDTAALRKFQNMWEPVLQAIPAVMELEAKQADMERWIAQHTIELAKAKDEIAAAYAEADVRLTAVNEQMAAAAADRSAAQAEAEAVRNSAKEAAKEADAKIKAKHAAADAAIADKQAKLKGLADEYAQKLLEAQGAHTIAVKEMEAQIADLEKRKAAAEKALDTLRAKLG